MDNTELLITNVYIPPASSCNGCYSPLLDPMPTGTDSLVLGDYNAHHSLWHSGTTDTRGNQHIHLQGSLEMPTPVLHMYH